ncbi:MAG: PEP-utilizing enzyme [Solirubrobacteraceae bacterium]
MSANPLHTQSGPGTTWTTVNFGEANPGVQTPLGLSFWLEASEASLVEIGYAVGAYSRREARLSGDADRRHMAGFYGRMAGNVNCFRELADRMPGTSGDAFEEQILGVVRSGQPNDPIRRRYPVVAAMLPLAGWRASREVARARADSEAWWRACAGRPMRGIDVAIATYAEAYRRFARLMYVHGLITMLAQACFEQVAALTAAAGMAGEHASLITGYGGLEETRLLCDLWDVAHGAAPLEGLIATYGYHGPAAGDLSSRSWREDPEPVRTRLAAYGATAPSEHPLARQLRQTEIRVATEGRLLGSLRAPLRPPARLLLRLTARFVSEREVGKTAYVQTLDVARAAARAAGRLLAASGVLAQPDDVFFLTTPELTGAVRSAARARERVAERRAFFERCRGLRIPDTWRGAPTPTLICDEAAADTGPVRLTGIGVAPGVVTGPARVVSDPFDAGELTDGDILVCETTNPSWVVLFAAAAALVIDVGGPLSHGAIAARELGIPCVINTRDGTRRLRTGEIVTVNGSTGVVERHPTHPDIAMRAGITEGERR